MGGLARSMQSGALQPLRKIADPGNLSAKYDPLAKQLLKPKPEAPAPAAAAPGLPTPGSTGAGLKKPKPKASTGLRRQYAAGATLDDVIASDVLG